MYPTQKQTFNITNEPAPVIWSTSGLTLNSDRTILASSGNSAVVLAVARSGVCRIKWTIEGQMIPASGNLLKFRMTANTVSGVAAIIVEAGPSSTVIKNNGGTTLATITRTLTANDY